MSATPVLYATWNSSCSWRVRIVMNFKGLAYEVKPISLMNKEQYNEEYLKINPMGFVPALKINDEVLIESYNIMMYLEENRRGYALIPKDEKAKIKVREICMIIIAGIQPFQNSGSLTGLQTDIERAQKGITRGFKALETIFQTTAGKYCVGDAITMADCCLVPQVFNARKYNVDLTPFPTIVRIDKELENHPAFASTHPYKQPDYPGSQGS